MCRGLCASDMLKDKNLNFYRKPANATSPHTPTSPSPILLVYFFSFVCTFLLLLSCFAYYLLTFDFVPRAQKKKTNALQVPPPR